MRAALLASSLLLSMRPCAGGALFWGQETGLSCKHDHQSIGDMTLEECKAKCQPGLCPGITIGTASGTAPCFVLKDFSDLEGCSKDAAFDTWQLTVGPCPSPPPPPSPSPVSPTAANLAASSQYCPGKEDLAVAYCVGDCPTLSDGGWSIHGGGGVATKTAFNLLGGYVEFDLDVSGVLSEVNANVYTISPKFNQTSFNRTSDYCDGAASGDQWCLEMDWVESNGPCGGASTIHTIEGPGSDGCTAWGCRTAYQYNNKTKFHMRIEYDAVGQWAIKRDGVILSDFAPQPDASTWAVVKDAYEQSGAVIYSSQWIGWVPAVDGCSTDQGSLDDSVFAVSNLVVSGTVVQGTEPRLCSTMAMV